MFLPAWTKALSAIPNLFVCYDRDEAGTRGAEHVATLLPQAKIVTLPDTVGPGGDITDFFVRLGNTSGDFRQLLRAAQPLQTQDPVVQDQRAQPTQLSTQNEEKDPRIVAIKAQVSLETIARMYIPDLKPSSRILIGRCIFHCDKHPSLVVYPDQNRFHCYGCGTHGDVIQFVMEAECLTLPQALRVLEKYLDRL